jgi:hypothetical protein
LESLQRLNEELVSHLGKDNKGRKDDAEDGDEEWLVKKEKDPSRL